MTSHERKQPLPFLADKRLLASKARWDSDAVLQEDMAVLIRMVSRGTDLYTEPTPAEIAAYDAETERRSLHMGTSDWLRRQDPACRRGDIVGRPADRASRMGQAHAERYSALVSAQLAISALTTGENYAAALDREPLSYRFALWLMAEAKELKAKIGEYHALNGLLFLLLLPLNLFAKASEAFVLPIINLVKTITRPMFYALMMLERACLTVDRKGEAGGLVSAFISFAKLKHPESDLYGFSDLHDNERLEHFGTPRRCFMTFLMRPLACHAFRFKQWEWAPSGTKAWFADPRSGRYFWAAVVLAVLYTAGFIALLPLTWPFVLAWVIGKPFVQKVA